MFMTYCDLMKRTDQEVCQQLQGTVGPAEVIGELQRRRLIEIKNASASLAESSKKLADSSRQMERLTKVLIALTVVLAVLALYPIAASVAPLLRRGAPPQIPTRPAVRQPVAPPSQGRGIREALPAATPPKGQAIR